ncbi:STAS-like domain-containing protein [Leisingera sp. JC11]|uniref:STAS-like domain-containing protein n=1 Tax=Leisingera sp. JC11 TaxID=3042469 RepID=UPI0034556EA7
MRDVNISIARIVGGGICVAADDGQKVYSEVQNVVQRGDRAVLSFSGVTRMTTAFLNAAVGQLYGEFPEATIRRHLAPPVDFEDWHLRRLKLVVDRAKQYFANEAEVSRAIRDSLGEGHDDDI